MSACEFNRHEDTDGTPTVMLEHVSDMRVSGGDFRVREDVIRSDKERIAHLEVIIAILLEKNEQIRVRLFGMS